MPDWIPYFLPTLLSVAHIAAALGVTADAVLRKRNVRSVIGWVGVAWLTPLVGSALYLLFGINRIKRRASSLVSRAARPPIVMSEQRERVDELISRDAGIVGLARLGWRVTKNPLLDGNEVVPLVCGDACYPEMLAAIEGAKRSISLQTYIFDADPVGEEFANALERAVNRGVAVRVLIDHIGSRYSRPSMAKQLLERGVHAATFLPTRFSILRFFNLRNHRKFLVVDGHTGFTGGMNIREGHVIARKSKAPVQCLHFKLRGPIVEDLQANFAMDWAFTTKERLQGEAWFPPVQRAGAVIARGVPDGPDEDLDKVLEIILGALSVANRRVRIVTPYFLPDDVVQRALEITALRAVEVEIVLPSKSNLPVVDWAMAPTLPFLLRKGVKIYQTPPPFDHTKIFIVDDAWCLIGSSNWDARSFRLNFEYNVECYDEELAASLNALVDQKIASAQRLDADTFRSRHVALRLRDGLARLATPYL
jgi:cardiolipin synthase